MSDPSKPLPAAITDATTPAAQFHSFAIDPSNGNIVTLDVMKRVDISELRLMGKFILVPPIDADVKAIGQRLCAMLDDELASRGKAAS